MLFFCLIFSDDMGYNLKMSLIGGNFYGVYFISWWELFEVEVCKFFLMNVIFILFKRNN